MPFPTHSAAPYGDGIRTRVEAADLERSTETEEWVDAYLPDGAAVADARLLHHQFVRFGAKKAVFKGCDFSYAVFEHSYFHKAKFVDCLFVGATFTDSVFRNAEFDGCHFQYARFDATIVPPAQLLRALPQEPNLKRDLCQDLRMNYEALGDGSAARACFLKEMEADADHKWSAWRSEEPYYKRKFPSWWDRSLALGGYLINRASRWLWGHGERPLNVLVSAAVLLAALVVIGWALGCTGPAWDLSTATFGNTAYVVAMMFLSQGPEGVDMVVPPPRVFLVFTTLCGYAALGLFVTSLYRRLARR